MDVPMFFTYAYIAVMFSGGLLMLLAAVITPIIWLIEWLDAHEKGRDSSAQPEGTGGRG